jgi:c-di-GMP-binding flagellar brake protein YcgR
MANIDIVEGSAILKFFEELQKDGLPLKMQLIGGEYERLTYIEEIHRWKKTHYFLIEYHENMPTSVDRLDDWRMRFEFVGKDNINCRFETGTDQIFAKKIWVRFPETIYRYQRRGHFRLEAPHGTRLCFEISDTHYDLLVINISLGGTLGVLSPLTKKMELELRKNSLNMLENLKLIFPSKYNNENLDDSTVTIKQCKMVRQRKNPRTHGYECAFEFKEMVEDQQNKLRTLFYECQRDYLKRRKRLKI